MSRPPRKLLSVEDAVNVILALPTPKWNLAAARLEFMKRLGIPRKYLKTKRRIFEEQRAAWLMRPDAIVNITTGPKGGPLWYAGLRNDSTFYGATRIRAVNKAVKHALSQ